ELFRQRSQAITQFEDVIHDVSHFDLKDQCITDKHAELNLKNQEEFGSRDENELNTIEDVSDPINIDVEVELKIELTTNFEL
ncbi:hypothetical protein J1N35_005647, partial [Gossypium stocksii]